MWTAIKSIFGFSGVGETALKIVEKVTGTDDSPDKQRAFLLAWAEATKHQSPMRRFIAAAVTILFVTLCLSWLIASAVGRFCYDEVVNPGTALAADISAFMSLNVSDYFGLVITFYFVMQITNGFKK